MGSNGKSLVGCKVEYALDGTTLKSAGQFKSWQGNKKTVGKVDVTTAQSLFDELLAGNVNLGDFSFVSVMKFADITTADAEVIGVNGVTFKFTLKDGSTVTIKGFVAEFDAIGQGDFKTGTQETSWTITLQDKPAYADGPAA